MAHIEQKRKRLKDYFYITNWLITKNSNKLSFFLLDVEANSQIIFFSWEIEIRSLNLRLGQEVNFGTGLSVFGFFWFNFVYDWLQIWLFNFRLVLIFWIRQRSYLKGRFKLWYSQSLGSVFSFAFICSRIHFLGYKKLW